MRTLISKGLVVTGDGSRPSLADILIEDSLIARVGKDISCEADDVVDAQGLVVTPGFIDAHRHLDYEISRNPGFGRIELSQGITTAFGGNCGMSGAPATGEWSDYISPCLGPACTVMDDFPRFLDSLDHAQPLDVGFFIGMGSVASYVKGMRDVPWTDADIDRAKNALVRAMESGAQGVSLGIMYEPEFYTSTDTYVEILSSVSRFHRPLVVHMRSEGDRMVDAVRECIDIAGRTSLPLVISHFKVFGRRNWRSRIAEAVGIIDDARRDWVDISVDFYPYDAGSTTMLTLVPPVVQKEDLESTIRYLDTPEGRSRFALEVMRDQPGWDNMVASIGWERVILSSASHERFRAFLSMDFISIAQALSSTPSDVFIDVMKEEAGKAAVIVRSMDGDDVDAVARLPYSSLISDSLYSGTDTPHPRLYGSFPRFIRDFALDRKVVSLEEAVWKMTGLPAQRYHLADRGLVEEGRRADLVLLDPSRIRDRATYAQATLPCEGIEKVYVAGRKVYECGRMVAHDCGRLLRREE